MYEGFFVHLLLINNVYFGIGLSVTIPSIIIIGGMVMDGKVIDARALCFMLTDVLNEYRLLEEPNRLRAVKRVQTMQDEKVRLLNPYILIELDNGDKYEIHIVKSK